MNWNVCFFRKVVPMREEELLMKDTNSKSIVPVWKKYSLSIQEAAEYYGIGEKRLRQIADANVGAEFILEIGTHIRFKRRLFEEYLDTSTAV